MNTDHIPARERKFYTDALKHLGKSQVQFLLGGAFALCEYTGVSRHTKDLDIFCKPADYERLLHSMDGQGYEIEVVNANWLAKAKRNGRYVDIIFNSANNICRVDQSWFDNARDIEFLGSRVDLLPAEELLWTKMFVQDRLRFDGADVLHLIRAQGRELDWDRLLDRMSLYWEILLSHLLTFRFVYPSERDAVPTALVRSLLERAREQLELPASEDKICRGPLLSRTQYEVDITEWGYEWGVKQL